MISSYKHINTTGAAENSIKSFKYTLMKNLLDSKKQIVSISTAISRYLFTYRISNRCTTGEALAKRLFGREIRNRLDILRNKETSPCNH